MTHCAVRFHGFMHREVLSFFYYNKPGMAAIILAYLVLKIYERDRQSEGEGEIVMMPRSKQDIHGFRRLACGAGLQQVVEYSSSACHVTNLHTTVNRRHGARAAFKSLVPVAG